MTSQFILPRLRPSTGPGRHARTGRPEEVHVSRDLATGEPYTYRPRSPRQRIVLAHRPAQLPPAVSAARIAESPWTSPVAVQV